MGVKICKECGAKLSKYNKNDICFHHRNVDGLLAVDSVDEPIMDKSIKAHKAEQYSKSISISY